MKPNPKEDNPFQGRVPKTLAQMTPAERRASEEWRLKCAQADKIPSKLSKRLAWGSWAGVLRELCSWIVVRWIMLTDSGYGLAGAVRGLGTERECLHGCEFIPDLSQPRMCSCQLRKHYQQFMKDTFNLSPRERSILGRSERAAPVKVQGKVIYPSKTDRENAGLLTDDEISELEKKYGLRTNDGKTS